MHKLVVLAIVMLPLFAAADKAKANHVPDPGKPVLDKMPPDVAQELDYAMIRMDRQAAEVLKEKQDEVNAEVARRQAPLRQKIRDIEQRFHVKMFDEKWIRCCDTIDPETGIVKKGSIKAK